MPYENCGTCTFRIPQDLTRFAPFGEESLRCALVKGPIRGQDVCDLFLGGGWIEDFRAHEEADKSRRTGQRTYEEYKLAKGHSRVNYKRRVKQRVEEKPPEPAKR